MHPEKEMSMPASLNERDWQIRLHVYQFFVEHERPPTVGETADHFGMTETDARAAYQRLHDGHALFLEPGTTDVRMANPLSGVETPYRVSVNGRRLYANCAWDSVGIPAMLGLDATIESVYTAMDTAARHEIVNGELRGDDGVVHFPLPFRRWYDDLIHT